MERESLWDSFPNIEQVLVPAILLLVVYIPAALVGTRDKEPAETWVLANTCGCASLEEQLAEEKAKTARLEQELQEERAFRKLTASFFFGSKLLRCVPLVRDVNVGDETARVRVGKKELEIEIFESPAPRKAGEFVTVARIAQLSEGFSLVNEPCTPRKK